MRLANGIITGFLFLLLLNSCSSSRQLVQPQAGIKALKFLGEYDIPYNFRYDSTTVGGLSGIDYDAAHNIYYLISDDRSDRNPARFYTAAIHISGSGIDSVRFTGVYYMHQPEGDLYPNNKQDPYHTPDPEAIRYDALHHQLVWSSEGERIVKQKDTILEDPLIAVINTRGKFKDAYQLPASLQMQAVEKGPRQNGVLEGMSFADNYRSLFVNVEEPLYEDGPRAGLTESNAYIRILKFDAVTKTSIAQYAYKLSPIAWPANPPDGFKINGVPDILSIGANKLLVIERSFSTGKMACSIKVFVADLSGATDVSAVTLAGNQSFIPVTKKLLLNMDELGIYTDNIEGVTFGPRLPNGHRSLVFVADNNFSQLEKAQLLLFEIEE